MSEAPEGSADEVAERIVRLGAVILLLVTVLLQVGEPSRYQLIVAVLTLTLGLIALRSTSMDPPPPPLAASVLWLGYGAVHALLLGSSGYLARLALARRGLLVGALAVFMAAGSSPPGLQALRHGILGCGGLAAASALADRVAGHGEKAHWRGGQEEGQATRVAGIFSNPNLLGGCLALVLPLALGAGLGAGGAAEAGGLVVTALVAAGLGATYSRSSWLAALVGVAVLGLLLGAAGRRTLAPRLVLVLVAGLLAAPGAVDRATSTVQAGSFGIQQRLALLAGVSRMVADRPALGVGLGSFHSAYPAYRTVGGQYPFDAHGQFLQEAVESGIVGAAIFLLWVAAALAATRRNLGGRDEEGRPDLAGAGAAALAAMLFASPFSYTPLGIVTMAVIGGATAPVARRVQRGRGAGTFWVLHAGLLLAVLSAIGVFLAEPARQSARAGLVGLEGLPEGPIRAAESQARGPDVQALLELAEARDPGAAEVPYRRARLLLAQGRPEAAEEEFQAVLDRDPFESLAWAGIAEARRDRGEVVEALRALESALALDPYAEVLLHEKSRLLLALGQVRDAEEALRQALATNPAFLAVNRVTYPPVMRDLIRLLESQGREDEARGWRRLYIDYYGAPPPAHTGS
jgi:tetratricopeptide (TPR) repeat protein